VRLRFLAGPRFFEDLADVGVGGVEAEGLFVGLDRFAILAIEMVGDAEVFDNRGGLGQAAGRLLVGDDRGIVLLPVQLRFADVAVGPADGCMFGIKGDRGFEGGDRSIVLQGIEVGDAEGVGVIKGGMQLLGLLKGFGSSFEFTPLVELLAAFEALLGLLDGCGGLGDGGEDECGQGDDRQGDDRQSGELGKGEGHGTLRITLFLFQRNPKIPEDFGRLFLECGCATSRNDSANLDRRRQKVVRMMLLIP
jgi:hypothetical protein